MLLLLFPLADDIFPYFKRMFQLVNHIFSCLASTLGKKTRNVFKQVKRRLAKQACAVKRSLDVQLNYCHRIIRTVVLASNKIPYFLE